MSRRVKQIGSMGFRRDVDPKHYCRQVVHSVANSYFLVGVMVRFGLSFRHGSARGTFATVFARSNGRIRDGDNLSHTH